MKQKKTVLVEKKLDSVRRLYKPLASVGQRLFFLVRMLHAVSPFYSFSLDWYKHLVRQALGKDSPPTLPTAPQQQIQQQVRATCTLHCYTQVEQTISFVANALLTMIYCWTMIYFLTMIHLLFLTTVGTKQSGSATLASIVAVDPVPIHLHARPAVVSNVDGVGTTALQEKDFQERINLFHPWRNSGNGREGGAHRSPSVCDQCRCLGRRAAVVHAPVLPWVECKSGQGRGWTVARMDHVVETGNIAFARAGTGDTRWWCSLVYSL